MSGLLAGFVLGLLTAAVAGIVHLWRLGAELVGPEGGCRATRTDPGDDDA